MPKPGTFEFYHNLLMEKLTEDGQTLENLDDQRLNQAAADVEEQIDGMGPDAGNLDQSFDEFCGRQEARKVAFRSMRAGSNTIGQQGESRYDYAKRCRHEVMEGIKQQIRQQMEWNHAIRNIGVVNENGAPKKISTRWMFYLMKLDGSPESRHYNESIAALGALGTGMITQEQYLNLRRNYYTQHGGKTPEEADAEAKNDLNNAAQYLYEEVSQRIEEHQTDFARGKEAALAIQNNDYSKFQGGMSEAFGIYYSTSAILAFVSKDILSFLSEKFNLQMSKEAQQDMFGEWQEAAQPVTGLHYVAELAANPYFALFDPAKYESSIVDPFIPDGKQPPKDALAYAFMTGGASYELEQTRELNAVLANYALYPHNEVRTERKQDFRVYHQDDRTVILKVGPRTADSFLRINDSVLVEYADAKGLRERADALLRRCADWSTEKRTSREFENMRRQLQEIKKLQLGAYPTTESMAAAAEAMEELRADAQAYLERKEVHHSGGAYENSRVAFAKDVLKFAKERQLRLSRCIEYIGTDQKRREAEIKAGPNPEWKSDPTYINATPLEYEVSQQRKAAEAAEAAERERQRREKEEAERPMREAQHAVQLADGERCAGKFDSLLAGCSGNVLPHQDAASQTETFISGEISRYRELVNHRKELLQQKKNALIFPDNDSEQEAAEAEKAAAKAEQDAFKAAKNVVAACIIAEMLTKENVNQEDLLRRGEDPNQIDTPFRKLVSGGKTEDLVEIISTSARFIEKFGEQLGDPKEMERLIEERDTNRETRKSCFYAGREFLENMNLARQEQKQQNAEIPVKENEIRPVEDAKGAAIKKITAESLEKAIEERLSGQAAGDPRKNGLEVLALSTMKCMVIIAQDVANVSSDALMAQVLHSEDFQKEAETVELTNPEKLRQALNDNFGKNAARTILEKAVMPPQDKDGLNTGFNPVIEGPKAAVPAPQIPVGQNPV